MRLLDQDQNIILFGCKNSLSFTPHCSVRIFLNVKDQTCIMLSDLVGLADVSVIHSKTTGVKYGH